MKNAFFQFEFIDLFECSLFQCIIYIFLNLCNPLFHLCLYYYYYLFYYYSLYFFERLANIFSFLKKSLFKASKLFFVLSMVLMSRYIFNILLLISLPISRHVIGYWYQKLPVICISFLKNCRISIVATKDKYRIYSS